MSSCEKWDQSRAIELVRRCVADQLEPGVKIPGDEEDLVKARIVDSMGWVGILTAIEDATEIRNFGNPWPEGRSQSIAALAELVRKGTGQLVVDGGAARSLATKGSSLAVSLVGWGYAFGSVKLEAVSIEGECGLPPNTIRDRAGIEFVCRADHNEDEVTLGQRAAEAALKVDNQDPEAIDVVVTTSATCLSFPSLAAALHTRLLLRESCGALDVGGACVGLIHALAAAKGLLSVGRHRVALVVASEVHSRRLLGPQVPGEFRGLFGDGACAFVLRRSDSRGGKEGWRLGDFVWGCSGTFASALRLELSRNYELDVQFKGEPLASAAIAQVDRVLDALENLSGRPRTEAYFAVHEPNPRIAAIFAQRAKIPLEKMPFTSKTCGNLGSATCGVSLCGAMSRPLGRSGTPDPGLIFMAAVGPGLIWGGTYLQRAR